MVYIYSLNYSKNNLLAGIAPNTMLAKVCSDQNKPNGQYYLTPTKEAVLDFVRHLDIRKVIIEFCYNFLWIFLSTASQNTYMFSQVRLS